MKKLVLIIVIFVSLFILKSKVFAAEYSVKQDGTGNFTTIQSCANAAQAGDSCLVYSGSYDERVTPLQSGTNSNPIIFKASGTAKVRGFSLTNKNYITLDGFELTNSGFSPDSYASVLITGSTGVRILNNYIHDTTRQAVRSEPWGGNKARLGIIARNTIAYIGPPGNRNGHIQCWCQDFLIENNDQSHGEDFLVIYGERVVIRNNIWHDSSEADANGAHIDGVQSYCTNTAQNQAANDLVIENNIHRDTPDRNSHFVLTNSQSDCGGTARWITRYNKISNLGSAFYHLAGSISSGFLNPATNHKVYNNTLKGGSLGVNSHDIAAMYGNLVSSSALINNIFVDAISDSAPREGYSFNNALNMRGDFNLFCGVQGANSCPAAVAWTGLALAEPNGIRNQDPQFVSSVDFNLQATSPARDSGGSLTTVHADDMGSGTSLIVSDTQFFQALTTVPGVQADWICVNASNNCAQISSITHGSPGTLILATNIARNDGDNVILYKDSDGTQVFYGSSPDIGAFEYNTESGPPTNSTPIIGDINLDHIVNAIDYSILNSDWFTSATRSDLNSDGLVNAIDFSMLNTNWFKTW